MRKIATILCWVVFVVSAAVFVAGCFALTIMKVPMGVGMLYGMFSAHWIATVMACVLALLLSVPWTRPRFWVGLSLSFLALMSSFWGLKSIHITRTQTVNGKFQCLFDSRWFFTTSLVLAVLALAFAVLKRWRSQYVA